MITRKPVKNAEPVLTPAEGETASFNPAVVYDGENYHMFFRAIKNGESLIGTATSTDGVNWSRTGYVAKEGYEIGRDVEDPRITKIGDSYWMTYTVYDGTTARLALARSTNLTDWERLGMPFGNTWAKAGVIVPEMVNGKYWMYLEAHRGATGIYYATSTDLVNWTLGEIVLRKRPDYFDGEGCEAGAALPVDDTILLLYNGFSGGKICVGWALFDRSDPTRLLGRCEEPIIVPEYDWEKNPDYTFLTSAVELIDKVSLYYGAGDRNVGLAIIEK